MRFRRTAAATLLITATLLTVLAPTSASASASWDVFMGRWLHHRHLTMPAPPTLNAPEGDVIAWANTVRALRSGARAGFHRYHVRLAAEARARAEAHRRAQEQQHRDYVPAPPPPHKGGCYAMVARAFSRLGSYNVSHALFVAHRESGCNPYAVNRYSGAAGVFQFMPRVWPGFSAHCGYGGSSVFNMTANIYTAACVVDDYGWGPWGG